jgi:hypothetical protein
MLYAYTEMKLYQPINEIISSDFFAKVFKLIYEHEAIYKEDVEVILFKTAQFFIRLEGESFLTQFFSGMFLLFFMLASLSYINSLDSQFWRQAMHSPFYFGTLLLALQRGSLSLDFNTMNALIKYEFCSDEIFPSRSFTEIWN